MRRFAERSTRVAHGSEIHPDDAIGELCSHIVRDRQREAGFADATWAGQRQERYGPVKNQCLSSGDLRLPANEPGARNG